MRPDGSDRPCSCDAWWALTQSRRRAQAPRSEGGLAPDDSPDVAPAGTWFARIRTLARQLESDRFGVYDRTDWQLVELAEQALNEEHRAFRRWEKWHAKINGQGGGDGARSH